MRQISPDKFQRASRSVGVQARQSRDGISIVLPVLMLVCVVLLVLSRIGHSYIETLRTEVEGLAAPVMRAALVPFEPIIMARRRFEAALSEVNEIDQLKAENQRLRQWQWKARELEEKIADLAIQSRIVRQQALPFITARVVAQGTGPFAHSALIDAGTDHGLKVGQPVINAYGLVGRIIATGGQVARVLLLTDFTSRIPVAVGPARLPAIMIGTNTGMPALGFVGEDDKFEVGQVVTTSGVGGALPSGMRLGTVASIEGRVRIELDAHLGDLQYLSVLFYENPAARLPGEVAGDGPAARVMSSRPPDATNR